MRTSVDDALLQLRLRAQLSANSLAQSKAAALAHLKEQQLLAGAPGVGHTPSGPRRKAEGIEDEQQGIVAAEATANGGALLRVTLLAAGYVIGPAGSSIREVARVSSADVRSWSESWQDPRVAAFGEGACPGRRVRTIIVEGKRRSVVHALRIIAAAVDRYCDLTGGNYCGKAVDRATTIDGVTFYYSPPPRAAVPFAAALRGHDRAASPPALKSPTADPHPTSAADKENAARASTGYTPLSSLSLFSPLPLSPRRQAQAHSPPPATPAAAHAHLLVSLRTAAPAPLVVTSAGPEPANMMEVDQQEEAATPAYRTYNLFGGDGGFGAGSSLIQRDAFNGGSSLFASAYEAATPSISAGSDSVFAAASSGPTPSSTSGAPGVIGSSAASSAAHPFAFLDATTPAVGASAGGTLLRSPSMSEDALLTATGFPAYSSFCQQAPFFNPSLFPATEPPGLAPAPSSLPSLTGPLAHLPLGQQGWGLGGASLWQRQQP